MEMWTSIGSNLGPDYYIGNHPNIRCTTLLSVHALYLLLIV